MYSFYEFLESEKDSSVKSSILFTAVLIFANDRIVKDIYKIGVSEMSNYHFYIPNPYFTKSGNKTKNIFVLVNRRTEFGNRNKEEFKKNTYRGCCSTVSETKLSQLQMKRSFT